MMVTTEAPLKERTVQPTVTRPLTPVKKTKIWPRLVGGAAALLVFGLGLGAGLAVNNGDIDALRDDVAALQIDLQTARDQLSDVRTDVIMLRSGYSLEREHTAQAPELSLSLGMLKEHLAQAPR